MSDFNLRECFEDILRIRLVEEAIAGEYPKQEMRCPVHLSIGQEAAAVGICQALRSDDWVFSAHRCHAHYLAKGGDLTRMLAEIYGRSIGCVGGRGGSMHLSDLDSGFVAATPIVGSTIPIAVGAALTSQLNATSRVVVAFFGEAAVETGVLHESINFACVRKLPVIFACENNQYSVYSPMEVRQPGNRRPSEAAAGHGLPTSVVDGNDVQAVWVASTDAVARARAGDGPTFIEMPTYRSRQHCGPDFDDDLQYRPPGEVASWSERDPVELALERLLVADPHFELEPISSALEAEIETSFQIAKSAPLATVGLGDPEMYA